VGRRGREIQGGEDSGGGREGRMGNGGEGQGRGDFFFFFFFFYFITAPHLLEDVTPRGGGRMVPLRAWGGRVRVRRDRRALSGRDWKVGRGSWRKMDPTVVEEKVNQKREFQEVTKDVGDFLAFVRVNTIKIQEGGDSEGNKVFKRIEAGDGAVA